METRKVICQSCDHNWRIACNGSLYERQAIESNPCPICGAYTLSTPEPMEREAVKATFHGKTILGASTLIRKRKSSTGVPVYAK